MSVLCRKSICWVVFGLLCASAFCASSFGAAPLMTSDRLREIMEGYYGSPGPGAAVMVMQGGETMFVAGAGLADLEWNMPVTTETSFRIGSVTKPITAIAILQLVEKGRVDLDQPISTYVPDLPGVLGQPTVRQLLSHTSGLSDHFWLPELPKIMRNPATPEGITAMMADSDLMFEPGSNWSYSNFNYVLLGRLIEALDKEGRDYGRYIEQVLFEPLGMLNSHYDRQGAVIPRRARGYDHDGTSPINTITSETSLAYAAGALMTSADDMVRFTRALLENKLLTEAMRAEAWTEVELPGGSSSGYGLGFNISKFLGETVIFHTGSINGFQAAWIHLPSSDRTVAVFCNGYYRPNPTTTARRILAEMAGESVPDFSTQDIDEVAWSGLQGRYKLDNGRILQIQVQDGARFNLAGRSWQELAYSGDDIFYVPDTLSHLRLRRGAGNRITGLVYRSTTLVSNDGTRVEGEIVGAQRTIPLDLKEAAEVAGSWMMNTGDAVIVDFDGKQLNLQLPYQPVRRILATATRRYFMRELPVSIVFDEDGRSAELNLYGTIFELVKQ